MNEKQQDTLHWNNYIGRKNRADLNRTYGGRKMAKSRLELIGITFRILDKALEHLQEILDAERSAMDRIPGYRRTSVKFAEAEMESEYLERAIYCIEDAKQYLSEVTAKHLD